MALLTRIKTSLTIPAQRRVAGLLDGAYASIHAGRSLDFADLRAYVPGDDVKDIDWNATARSDEVLVKRYVGDRKHTIMVVVDTGREMAGTAAIAPTRLPGEGAHAWTGASARAVAAPGNDSREKATTRSGTSESVAPVPMVSESVAPVPMVSESVADVAITVAGLLGWLAVGHGDYASIASMGADGPFLPRPTLRETELERMLVAVQESSTPESPPARFDELVRTMIAATRRRTVMFLVTADVMPGHAALASMRRLAAQHQLVHIAIGELDPEAAARAGRELRDVDSGLGLPSFVGHDAVLAREFARQTERRHAERARALEQIGVPHAEISPDDVVITQVLSVLERMRHVSTR
ncbi:PF01882 family protein [Propionibacterium freudenreichii]|uniref:DUF58 domain-containing protein n=1 Tax=Propionibacterium freudenreichii TaxID=1744 RepID=UPI000BC30223|nr:DUF58 domain-containing protein [Propionibacterium freudenreichii]SBN59154.1 PF01882 family protein [Propionibacterium freudenreichii]SCQ47389.1 PF01882 family protein [Propionibacterium freudenreichii]SCQ50979.1 PF01882 family protein [Propionibacterium freudenreichii]